MNHSSSPWCNTPKGNTPKWTVPKPIEASSQTRMHMCHSLWAHAPSNSTSARARKWYMEVVVRWRWWSWRIRLMCQELMEVICRLWKFNSRCRCLCPRQLPQTSRPTFCQKCSQILLSMVTPRQTESMTTRPWANSNSLSMDKSRLIQVWRWMFILTRLLVDPILKIWLSQQMSTSTDLTVGLRKQRTPKTDCRGIAS